MPQDLIGCWNQRKLKALNPCVVVFANEQPSAERRIDFAAFFLLFYGLIHHDVVGTYALICAIKGAISYIS